MKLFHLLCCLLPVATYAQVDTTQRPAYHFTAIKNWIKDPNGMIYINGQYHLYLDARIIYTHATITTIPSAHKKRPASHKSGLYKSLNYLIISTVPV